MPTTILTAKEEKIEESLRELVRCLHEQILDTRLVDIDLWNEKIAPNSYQNASIRGFILDVYQQGSGRLNNMTSDYKGAAPASLGKVDVIV